MSTLKMGSKGEDVKRLQRLLNSMVHPPPGLDVDGDFGGKTLRALMRFQSQNALQQSGVVDTQVWTALGQKTSNASASEVPPAPNAALVAAVANGPAWLQVAIVEYGVHNESLPGEHNKRIIEYHSTTTLKATADETAWCSSFVNWVMGQAGYRGTNSAAAKSWLNWGLGIDPPQFGAVTVIFSEKIRKAGQDRGGTGSTSGFHVGFFVSGTSSHVRLLGGNQSKQVKTSNYPLSEWEIKGYRWPG